MWKSRTRLYLAVASLVCAGAGSAFSQGFGPVLHVNRTEAGFTIESEGATLPQLLTAIGQEAGFSVQDTSGGAGRAPIPFFAVQDATLESTLRKLLGTSSHLIVYRGGSGTRIEDGNVEKIVLLSQNERERKADVGTSSLAGPPGTQAPARTWNTRRTRRSARPDGEPRAGRKASMTDGDDPKRYGNQLDATNEERIESMEVDPTAVAGGEPGAAPGGIPADMLQQIEEYADLDDISPDARRRLEEFAVGSGALPPPELVAPLD